MSLTLKANLIGIAAIMITVVYVFYDLTHSETSKPCTEFYPPSVSLNLQSGSGEALTPAALQGRSNGQDWGLLKNLKIEEATNAPVARVFDVALPTGDVSSFKNKRGGIGFPWQPSRLRGAKSVCFAYHVWIPDDFDFREGGILPGLASQEVELEDGSDDSDEVTMERKLRAHMGWSGEGQLQVFGIDLTKAYGSSQLVLTAESNLVPGRWQKLQQEMVLNDEGLSNGTVRLWADNALVIEETGLAIRKSGDTQFDTVLYHVSRGTPFGIGDVTDQANSSIRVSPLELAWK